MIPHQEVLYVYEVQKMIAPSSKQADLALLCWVDICRAAAYTPPDQDIPLRAAAVELAYNLKVGQTRVR